MPPPDPPPTSGGQAIVDAIDDVLTDGPAAAEPQTVLARSAAFELDQQIAGRQAQAQGTLQQTPLLHLLVYSLDRTLTGSTVLQAPDGQRHVIAFDRGRPAKVRTGSIVEPLDRVLLDMGQLDAATLSTSLQVVSQHGILHGQYLVTQGLIDAATLITALEMQVVRKVGYLVTLPTTSRFAYYDGLDLLANYGGPESAIPEPLSVIMAGVRASSRDPVVDQTLTRLGSMQLVLHPDAEPSRLALAADEQQVVERLRAAPTTLAELPASAGVQPRVAQLTVYALVITRSLALGGAARAPVGHDPNRPRVQAAAPKPPPPAPPGPPAAAGAPAAVPHTSSRPRRSSPTGRHAAQPDVQAARPGRPAGPARGAAPLPRRGAATGRVLQPGEVRRSAATGQGRPDARPRRAAPTGRGAQAEPRRSAPTGGGMARRGSSTGRGAAPLPRRGTRSTGVAPADAIQPGARPTTGGGAGLKASRAMSVQEIDERLSQLDELTHYELFGLPPDASAHAVQAVYFQLAKAWHPDRLPKELAEHRPKVAKIFGRYSEAHRTLSDPAQRQQYDALVAQGAATSLDRKKVDRAMDSAVAFRKATVLIKKGQWDKAEALLQQAVATDPDQPEYLATLAWTQIQLPGSANQNAPGGAYAEQLAMLDQAVSLDPQYERAVFYRAEVLKRMGQLDRALKDYRAAAQLNPHNIDAAREVRLHDMRKKNEEDEGGLIGRLFSRSKKNGS